MPNPKRRHSKTRTRLRRGSSAYKTEVKNVISCSNCGAAVLFHHVCPECGFYKGKLVIEKKPVS